MTRFALPGNSRQSGAGLSTEPGVVLSMISCTSATCKRAGQLRKPAGPQTKTPRWTARRLDWEKESGILAGVINNYYL